MSLIGVINSDEDLNTKILDEFRHKAKGEYQFRIPEGEERILQFLNYDFPEIVIINLSDKKLNLNFLFEQIKDDSWLYNFGIIGLYDREKNNEKALLEGLKQHNLLTLLDYSKIKDHLVNNIRIVDQNRQIIFQREIAEKFVVDNITGSFALSNDGNTYHVYAGLVANLLYHLGYIDSEAKLNLQLALSELILNGIEHGNCRISSEEKEALLMTGGNVIDLIEEKCKDPEIAKKKVYLEWDICSECSKLIIRDEGDGFDVKNMQEKLKKNEPDALLGRGIMLARLCTDTLCYNKKGNQVSLTLKHKSPGDRGAPAGFSNEEILFIKSGETIFKQDDLSNYIYYISSGKYGVYHDTKLVGTLTPEDIFMGEMSFLLNNKRSATVVAETSGKLIRISRKAFVNVVREYPHYGIFLSKLLARKLVRANSINATYQQNIQGWFGES
jgi:anti-sigma regulatory factor (Ser/Thr protein kinase)